MGLYEGPNKFEENYAEKMQTSFQEIEKSKGLVRVLKVLGHPHQKDDHLLVVLATDLANEIMGSKFYWEKRWKVMPARISLYSLFQSRGTIRLIAPLVNYYHECEGELEVI